MCVLRVIGSSSLHYPARYVKQNFQSDSIENEYSYYKLTVSRRDMPTIR